MKKSHLLLLLFTLFTVSLAAGLPAGGEAPLTCNAEFSFPSTGNCIWQAVQFTDLSSTSGPPYDYITTWIWNFGDGTPDVTVIYPANPNVQHTFAGSALSHQVTLTIITSSACTDSETKTVTLTPSPLANFSWPATGNCAAQSVQFTDLSQTNGGGTITTWNWNFGDPLSSGNTATTQNPAHLFSGPGTYSVMLTVTTNNGCSGTISKTVTIGSAPVPTLSGPASACTGSTGNVYSTETGMSGYVWNVSSGGTVTAGGGTGSNMVTVSWNSAGSRTVSVSYTNSAGCTASSPTVYNVTVNPLPVATITAGGPTTFCEGGSVVLTASAASSYLWSNGATTQSITATAAGVYIVTCTGAGGCSATSAGVTVTVQPLPVATVTASGPLTFCEGGSVTLTASAATSYLWNTGATAQSITTGGSGLYSVTCTNGYGCSATSAGITVTTLPLPEVSGDPSGPDSVDLAATGSSVYATAGSPSAGSYEWDLAPANAGNISGTGTSGMVAWNNAYLGTAVVKVRSLNSCGESPWSQGKTTLVKNSLSGIGNGKENRSPEIYPNPATVRCGVRCAKCENELCKVTITDLSGRKVKDIFTGKFPAGGIEADLTGLPAGVFFISIHTGEGVILKKLIIL